MTAMKPASVWAIIGPNGVLRSVQHEKHAAWMQFFSYASGGLSGARHALPLEEAMRAYRAIGYRCVECTLTEVVAATEDEDA